jgi:hypothetical protein
VNNWMEVGRIGVEWIGYKDGISSKDNGMMRE